MMRSFPRLILTGLGCVAVVGGLAYWLLRADEAGGSDAGHPGFSSGLPGDGGAALPESDTATFPDPTAPPGSSDRVFVDPQAFDSLILAATAQFTDKVQDESSLREYREAISHRAERAKSRLRQIAGAPPPRPFAVAGPGDAGPLGLPSARVRRPLRG